MRAAKQKNDCNYKNSEIIGKYIWQYITNSAKRNNHQAVLHWKSSSEMNVIGNVASVLVRWAKQNQPVIYAHNVFLNYINRAWEIHGISKFRATFSAGCIFLPETQRLTLHIGSSRFEFILQNTFVTLVNCDPLSLPEMNGEHKDGIMNRSNSFKKHIISSPIRHLLNDACVWWACYEKYQRWGRYEW